MSLTLKCLLVLCIFHLSSSMVVINSDPPPPSETARTARYIIHECDWATVSTISTLDAVKGYPLGNLKSMSDGPVANGTGVPYLFVTEMDLTGKDFVVDSRSTLMASLAETDYCERKDYDPQDPRCARVIVAGHLLKLDNTTEEYEFAKSSIFSRHPAMAHWPKDHLFYIVKLNVENVMVLDYIGRGVEYVTPKEYFNANGYTDSPNEELLKNRVHI